MCCTVCRVKVSQWNRFRAGNCFYHCRVKVWLAWHTGRSINNGPSTHNPLAAGHSSHSSHYSTQRGTNNQNISFSPNCGSTCWTQTEDIFVAFEKFKCEGYWKWFLPRRSLAWAGSAGGGWRTSCERRSLGCDRGWSGVLCQGMDEKLIWSLHKLSWITQGWSA